MNQCTHNWEFPSNCPMCRADSQTVAAKFRMAEERAKFDAEIDRKAQLDRIEDKLDRLLRVMR